MRYADCHPDRRYNAKGLCKPCYEARWSELHPEATQDHKRREYAKNRRRYLETARLYYIAHREQIIKRVALWNLDNPKRRRINRLARDYGLSDEQYREHVIGQAGRCLVCLRVPSSDLVVDHEHRSGRIRGLLCHACNLALGHLQDDPARAAGIVRYLGASV